MKRRRAFVFLLLLFCGLVLQAQMAAAKDQWLQVRSKNFNLIGNASEKDIRRVATRLEQFRETFRQLFGQANLNSPIATNVIVFKNDSAYRPFKPKRGDGKIDTFVAGFFQPGEDVNYITLSTEGENSDTFGTIFHEYVHFIVNTSFGKSEIPPWFNEGLAEYYQTFAIEDDQKVKLGLPQNNHLALLQQYSLIPLADLFKVSNYELLQQGNHSRSLFYAESWALVHYILRQSGKADGLSKFLTDSMSGMPPEKAFRDAFQISYADMEKALKTYVSGNTYKYQLITLPKKLTFDTEMQASPLDEADTNAYLGDLLSHTNRPDDAVPYLQNALTQKPDLSMANTTLGMIYFRDRKYNEAKTYLEKAVAEDPKNHIALFRYAEILSREGRDEFGFGRSFPAEKAAKVREILKKAIAINPGFTESYELLAYISLLNNEQLDESVGYLHTALRYQPGNQRYALRLAEVLLRQGKFDESKAIADKIAKTSDDSETKSHAESMVREITQRAEVAKMRATRDADSANQPRFVKRPGGRDLTSEEIAKAEEEADMRSLNKAILPRPPGESEVIGSIEKIDCRKGITYAVKTSKESFTLTSKDFDSLKLRAFVADGDKLQVGCGQKIDGFNAVIRFRPSTDSKSQVRGELTGITFVPANFRFIDLSIAQEPPPPGPRIVEATPGQSAEEQGRAAMLQLIRDTLQKPAPGEKQQMGFIEKSECSPKGAFFYLKTADGGIVKLKNPEAQKLHIRGFTPDVENVQFGCGMKALDVPVVFIYSVAEDAKTSTAGQLVSLEFVPKSFSLN